MEIEVRLKSGFFETTPYRLEIGWKQLRFLPVSPENGVEISLHESDILSVMLLDKKPPQFEIQTDDRLYIGTFVFNDDLTQLFHRFKSELNVQIICEYEGGI